jgi:hypothetical protein
MRRTLGVAISCQLLEGCGPRNANVGNASPCGPIEILIGS